MAEFLRDNLRKEGFQARELVAEDWGRMLPTENDQFPLRIGCGNYDEYAEGFLCFIEPHTPFVRRLLRRIETGERVASLQQAMDNILSDPAGVREKRWWTHDEFITRSRTIRGRSAIVDRHSSPA